LASPRSAVNILSALQAAHKNRAAAADAATAVAIVIATTATLRQQ